MKKHKSLSSRDITFFVLETHVELSSRDITFFVLETHVGKIYKLRTERLRELEAPWLRKSVK